MVLGDGHERERKISRCLDSRGGGGRVPVSPLFELDGLGISESSRVQLDSPAGAREVCGGDLLPEPVALGVFLMATGKQCLFFLMSREVRSFVI
jgi:hypothetical protein